MLCQMNAICLKAVARLSLVIITAILCATTFAEENPLHTADQHYLDTLAISLHRQNPYEDIKRAARNQFLSTAQLYGYGVDSEHSARRLEVAVEELAFGSMQHAVNNDPASPKIYWTLAPPRNRDWAELPVPGGRYGLDNPDCIYRTITVSDLYNYKIYGKRTGVSASDITFSLQNSLTSSTIAILAGKDLIMDRDGSFTITVNSTISSSPNHLRSTPAARLLLIRHNIGDWLIETPDELEVELIGKHSAGGHTEDTIIAQAREYMLQTIPPLNFVLGNLTLSNPVNSMVSPTQSQGMGLATQALVLSHYNLSRHEALIITVEPGSATYWSLNTYGLWIASDDPRNRLESLNNKQATVSNNGSYTFVLSGMDPKVSNWLNTTEEGVGTIVARFQGISIGGDAVSYIRVWAQLRDLDDLHLFLPHDTIYIEPQQRAKQMLERAEGYDRIHSLYRSCPANTYQKQRAGLSMASWGINFSDPGHELFSCNIGKKPVA